MIVVKNEHIQKGIDKYDGKRHSHLEQLLSKGKLNSYVYQFSDGRFLVHNQLINVAFLYDSKQELLDKLVLTEE